MDENKKEQQQSQEPEEEFGCLAMKPEGVGVPTLVFKTKEEYEAFRKAVKGPGRAYYKERCKRVKWDMHYDPYK